MKITETLSKDEWGEDGTLEIELITDKFTGSVQFGSGEPEDMTLNRDLSDAYSISNLLVAAYEAGKRGEDIEEIFIDEDDE